VTKVHSADRHPGERGAIWLNLVRNGPFWHSWAGFH